MLTCTKQFCDFPFAHRAPKHDGHCQLIHGHNWTFEVTFAATDTDENGFVMDFGKLKDLRAKFCEIFDHTLLLNKSDPLLANFEKFLGDHELNNVRIVRDCSCEGIAMLVYHICDVTVKQRMAGRVWVSRVVVYEDSKNSACYEP
jgi:6-pyruvoyltetrahydropterin/6-carboxytetrahydropterin synthase